MAYHGSYRSEKYSPASQPFPRVYYRSHHACSHGITCKSCFFSGANNIPNDSFMRRENHRKLYDFLYSFYFGFCIIGSIGWTSNFVDVGFLILDIVNIAQGMVLNGFPFRRVFDLSLMLLVVWFKFDALGSPMTMIVKLTLARSQLVFQQLLLRQVGDKVPCLMVEKPKRLAGALPLLKSKGENTN